MAACFNFKLRIGTAVDHMSNAVLGSLTAGNKQGPCQHVTDLDELARLLPEYRR